MVNANLKQQDSRFYVIHPLDDVQERKRDATELGAMHLTRPVRWTLYALRAYVILITMLVALHAFALAGSLGRL